MINHEMRICLGIHFAFYMQTLHLIKLKSAAAFRTFISLSTVHSNIIAILWNWKKNWTNLSFTSCTIKRNSLKEILNFLCNAWRSSEFIVARVPATQILNKWSCWFPPFSCAHKCSTLHCGNLTTATKPFTFVIFLESSLPFIWK